MTSIGIVAPSSAQVSSLTGLPRDLEDTLTWRLIDVADGSEVIAESSDDIAALDVGNYQHPRYDRAYTAPTETGRYREVWRYGSREAVFTIAVAEDPPAFATADDVAARLGQDLSEGEQAAATTLTQAATALIAEAASMGDDWAYALDPVPHVLKSLCVELAIRAQANPGGLTALREQLGSYSYSQQFRDIGVTLTEVEERIVRRVVHGRTTTSVKVGSGFAQAERLLRREQGALWIN